jgi:aromatic ring-opening dioxygenase catalytic subunit (LigB family)
MQACSSWAAATSFTIWSSPTAQPGREPYDWARRFDAAVRGLLAARDHDTLVNYHRLGPDARLAVPTPDH